MAEAGYSPDVRLALDDAYLGFVREFEQLREMTKLVDAPERDKRAKAQVPVPVYSTDDLKRFLDIPVDGPIPTRLSTLEVLDDSAWAGVDWNTP